ncbi:TIGR03016 family PEP-CTERM system-associated outer membrane protein [Janthinobacterium sp.]|uniref:TIGR03016 family PEP-CTERM system-associated outer membrane protein n=1 Tax=Janthinobacterium sp. TaxID=1871054 RepID=UPI00293D965C|nr:TIGR03016 family PEP-CTERM system-associated outer membrane protein [Janthinobacterium sp.]
MAKGRARKPVRLPLPLALAAMLMAPACRAQWTVAPTLELHQSYTDNVALSGADAAQSQMVSELVPGLALSRKGPRFTLNASFQEHLFAYSKQQSGGTRKSEQQLQASLHGRLLGELLFLDGSAAIGEQTASAFGPQINDNPYATSNRTMVRSYRVAPYLSHHFSDYANAELRYTRDAVRTDAVGPGRSDGDGLALSLRSGAMFRDVGWGLRYSRQHVQAGDAGDTTARLLNLNLRYQLTAQVALTADAGRDQYDYAGQGGAPTSGRSWSAGLDWTPSPRSSLQVSLGRRYFGADNSLHLSHRSRNTVWMGNYTTSVSNGRSEFLQTSTTSTADLLDRLLSASIPDAAARRLAVDAYIRNNNVPATLNSSAHYVSNRYELLHQFQISGAFNLPRTTIVVTLFDTRRSALSQVQIDNALLGSSGSSANDNTRQTGGAATVNWRPWARTAVNLGLTYSKSDALGSAPGAAVSARNQAVRLGLTRQFPANLSLTAELRHVRGETALGATPARYTENALVATLSKRF